METEPTYRYYPELTAAAIRQNRFKTGLRIWEYLIGNGGAREIETGRLIAVVALRFALEKRQIYRALSAGNLAFWDCEQGKSKQNRGLVRIYQADTVASNLGIPEAGPFEARPMSEINGVSCLENAVRLLDDYYRRNGRVRTRKDLQEIIGITERSQRSYTARVPRGRHLQIISVHDTMEQCRTALDRLEYERSACYAAEKMVFRDGIYERLCCILRDLGDLMPDTGVAPTDRSGSEYVGTSCGQHIWIKRELCQNIPVLMDLVPAYPIGVPALLDCSATAVRVDAQDDTAIVEADPADRQADGGERSNPTAQEHRSKSREKHRRHRG